MIDYNIRTYVDGVASHGLCVLWGAVRLADVARLT